MKVKLPKNKLSSLSIGFALFSMFFGAGNITFPLMLGKTLGKGLLPALIGLILTSVCIPFAGLLSITLFKGDYREFFKRIGNIPSLIVILLLLCIIGPFGGIPRCITLTFSTLKVYFTSMELLPFTLIACAIVFLFSWKQGKIIDLIGYVLAPLLVILLGFIVIKGIVNTPLPKPLLNQEVPHPFLYGLKEGYNTMDLMAAFFFSSLVYQKLRLKTGCSIDARGLLGPIFKASLVGAFLLSLVYIGFSYVASNYRNQLMNIPIDQLLGKTGQIILGPYAGLIVCLSIALTCLTTAIALTAISAEFLQKEVFKNKLRYELSLFSVLFVTATVSSLEFNGIVALLAPILEVIYPSLLVLCVFNILYKLYNVHPIKVPVFATMLVVLYFQKII